MLPKNSRQSISETIRKWSGTVNSAFAAELLLGAERRESLSRLVQLFSDPALLA